MHQMNSPRTGAPAIGAVALSDSLLAGTAMDALKQALQAELRPGGHIGAAESAIREALRLLCTEAHRHTVRAEQLLVTLKQAWVTLPEVQELAPDTRRQLLDRLITLAIQAYYATPADQHP
jgi:hypothetical protein